MKRREFGQGLASGVVVASLLPAAGVSPAAALPSVTGPVTGGRHGYPFTAYIGDIDAIGYTEEEFFLDGVGTQYDPVGELTPDGKWTLSPAGTVPFRTRLLVQRPSDPARFNGVVVVEWLNVTAGYDTATIGTVTHGIQSDGCAYVGVTCQRVGVEGFPQGPQALKAWDPERYGTLSIPGDSISYDIFSQAGRAVGPNRPQDGVDPLRGLAVKKVVATGASQSAGRLVSYINGVHPNDRVFDGFVPTLSFGLSFGFADMVLDPSAGGPPPRNTFIRTGIRDDLDVPVFLVNSETETLMMYPSRQPDTDRFRFWEVAGASHVPQKFDAYLAALRERDGLTGEMVPNGSKVLWEPSADAAFSHLYAWMMQGTNPPNTAPIEVKAGEPPEVVRDEFGNARGGVRLPEVEVPIARYQAAIQALNATQGLRGETIPFTPEELKRLYPSHEVYVQRVSEAAHAAEAAGVIKPARVAEYLAEAESTPIGD